MFAQLMIIIRLPQSAWTWPSQLPLSQSRATGERVNILFMPFPLRTCRKNIYKNKKTNKNNDK